MQGLVASKYTKKEIISPFESFISPFTFSKSLNVASVTYMGDFKVFSPKFNKSTKCNAICLIIILIRLNAFMYNVEEWPNNSKNRLVFTP